jgi:YHS domain-containing protein
VSRGKKQIKTVSPSPATFKISTPVALKREATTLAQKDFLENTIIYGEDNAFPLRLAKAVEDSPATSSCIRTRTKFIRGASFSDPELMKIKVNNKGQTLWDLHDTLCKSFGLFEGFAVNFKYNKGNRFLEVHDMSFESVRFVKPEDDLATEINQVKYNPYFGTVEYDQKYTKLYNLFNLETVKQEHAEAGNAYMGQVYYFGTTSPLHRFYPFPTYYSAKHWISADAKFQEFMDQELENGFFQSVLFNMIGDPNAPSGNPKYQETYTEDGVQNTRSTKTVGEEFNEMMAENFSGSKKAGTAMVLWALTQEAAATLSAFPAEILSDRLETKQNLTTKNITIATNVMAILANISEGVNLGSGGSELQKAVEIMQANTADERVRLEQFYNEILLPNLQVEGNPSLRGKKVEIVNYSPITVPVEINDKVWEWLNDDEKAAFVKKNMPNITIIRPQMGVQQPLPGTEQELDEEGQPLPAPPPPNEALKNLNMQQITRVQKIVARYNIGLVEPENAKALTFEQAKAFLLSYGLTESDIPNWLITQDQLMAS